MKIIKSNDGRSNKTKNQNLIAIIKDPNNRIEKIIDKTHPVSEKEIEDIKNDTHKIMIDTGTDPANLQELTGNIVIKNPEIARILLRLGQLVEEYQGLLNEERKTNPENTQRLKELEEMMNDIENRVISIVNQELAREIDIALDIPLLTRIRNIFQREGLTIAAIAGALGTIIFAIVFGVSNTTKSIVPGPGPSPGPGPQPTPTPGPTPDSTIPDKIKNFIINALKKVAEILKKIAAWAAATLPGLIGSIVSTLPGLIGSIVSTLPGLIGSIVSTLPGLIGSIVSTLPGLIGSIVSILPGLIGSIVSTLPGLIGSIVSTLPGLIGSIVSTLPGLIGSIVSTLPGLIGSIVATLPGLIGSIVSWLFDKAATMVTFLAEHVFIVIMLLLGFSFRVIIDYLEKKSRK